MKFLEEISSLSHSVVFLYFFALIAEEAFLSLLAILWMYLLLFPLGSHGMEVSQKMVLRPRESSVPLLPS